MEFGSEEKLVNKGYNLENIYHLFSNPAGLLVAVSACDFMQKSRTRLTFCVDVNEAWSFVFIICCNILLTLSASAAQMLYLTVLPLVCQVFLFPKPAKWTVSYSA